METRNVKIQNRLPDNIYAPPPLWVNTTTVAAVAAEDPIEGAECNQMTKTYVTFSSTRQSYA